LAIDRYVDARLPVLSNPSARWLNQAGLIDGFAFAIVVLVGIALSLGDRFSAITAAIGCPMAALITERIAKPLVGRQEPLGLGFPSGHSATAAALAGVAALIVYRRWGEWGLVAVVPVSLLWPAVMALAVIRLQFHYFTDTVGGTLVGYGTVAAVGWFVSTILATRVGDAPTDGVGMVRRPLRGIRSAKPSPSNGSSLLARR
jgi:membrane-associated phospholipid phosphatase